MTQTTAAGVIPEWTQSDRFRKTREHAGLTQVELADEIDVHRDTISKYEAGKVAPRRIVARQWALRCGVDFEWLMNGPRPGTTKAPADAEALVEDECAIRDLNPEPAD